MMKKTYTELMKLESWTERLEYLKTKQAVGFQTFGPDRYFNQRFYDSTEWRRARDYVIVRDNGCDLAVPGLHIYGGIIVHHLTPITLNDIKESTDALFNPENLICVSHNTHNLIHYQMKTNELEYKPREPFDTCPWRRQ